MQSSRGANLPARDLFRDVLKRSYEDIDQSEGTQFNLRRPQQRRQPSPVLQRRDIQSLSKTPRNFWTSDQSPNADDDSPINNVTSRGLLHPILSNHFSVCFEIDKNYFLQSCPSGDQLFFEYTQHACCKAIWHLVRTPRSPNTFLIMNYNNTHHWVYNGSMSNVTLQQNNMDDDYDQPMNWFEIDERLSAVVPYNRRNHCKDITVFGYSIDQSATPQSNLITNKFQVGGVELRVSYLNDKCN